jgi:hypothetical protein
VRQAQIEGCVPPVAGARELHSSMTIPFANHSSSVRRKSPPQSRTQKCPSPRTRRWVQRMQASAFQSICVAVVIHNVRVLLRLRFGREEGGIVVVFRRRGPLALPLGKLHHHF